jgi:hypothetical protein
MSVGDPTAVVVWGNCQAPPLADLLRAPLAGHGLHLVTVKPVYLNDVDDLRRVHDVVRRSAVLVSQPVSDEYRVPGCGTDQLTALLPPGGRLVRLPVVYDVGAFPFQVHGYTGTGDRIDAPLTDYHDLRMLQAAAAGWSPAETVQRWPRPAPGAVRAVAERSLTELRRREAALDVTAADLVRGPDALWTMTHPSNRVLATLAQRVLAVLGVTDVVRPPEREFLGQRQAAVDAETARVLGWSATARPDWTIDGAVVGLRELAQRQLSFYASDPDVVTASLRHAGDRLRLLAT